MTPSVAYSLSDRSVLLALQELTEEIGGEVSMVARDGDEATALLAALFAAANRQADLGALADHSQAMAAGRRLLDEALRDPDTAPPARAIVADPPRDDQLSVEAATAAIVVLGALIAWLQTKVDIKVSSRDGKKEFEFRLVKSATNQETLRRLVDTASRLLGGPQG